MAEVHKNLVDKGEVEAFKRREDFEREVKAFYEKHMDAIKSWSRVKTLPASTATSWLETTYRIIQAALHLSF